MANASLDPIKTRLNGLDPYHPADANTFADWSMEAGDVVTMKRGEEEYEVPVHSTRMTWKGAPQIAVNSTGSKEREAIANASKRKYGRGSSAMRNENYIYHEFTSSDGMLYSAIYMSESKLQTVFSDAIESVNSTIIQTASEIYSAVYSGDSSVYSYVLQTATQIYSHVGDVESGLHSEINQTADQIYSAVYSADSTLYAYVNQTASGIRQTVANTASGLQSNINQQANRISLVVEGTGSNASIKAAQIALAINNDQSEAYISANKIKLNGNTIVDNGHFRVKDSLATFGTSLANLVTIAAGTITANRYDYKDSSSGNAVGMLKKAQVDGNTLKIWKFGDADSNPSITFSKATTLGGAWSGSELTVTASPQGETYTIGFGSQSADEKLAVDIDRTTPPEPISGTKYIRVPLRAYTPRSSSTVPDVDRYTVSGVLSVASLLEDRTGTNKVTANGTYAPSSGYMGISAIEVDVPSQTITPVLTSGWSGTTFSVSSTPAAASNVNTVISSKHSYDSSIGIHFIDIDAADNGAQQAVTRAKYQLALNTGSVSSGSRTIEVKYDGAGTGLTYVCPDYGNGHTQGLPASGTASNYSGSDYDWVFAIKSADNTSTNLTIDATSIYNEARQGYYTEEEYDENWTTGFNAGVPTALTLGTNVTGTTYNVSIARGEYDPVAKTINLANAYEDAREGYVPTSTGKEAATYDTSTSDQVISAGQYLKGDQTIRAVTTSGIEEANIKSGEVVKVGDAGSDTRIITATGTFTAASTVSEGQTAATADKILPGYSAWVDGAEVKGTSEAIYTQEEYDSYGSVRYEAGQGSVTLTDPVWTHTADYTDGTSNTVTVYTSGRPTQLDKAIPVTIVENAWAANKRTKTVDIQTTNGAIVARRTINADTNNQYWYERGGNEVAPFLGSKTNATWDDGRVTKITKNATYYLRARYKNYNSGSPEWGPYASGTIYTTDTTRISVVVDVPTGGSTTHNITISTNSAWHTGSGMTEDAAKDAAARAMECKKTNLTHITDGRFMNNSWVWFKVTCGTATKYYYTKIT